MKKVQTNKYMALSLIGACALVMLPEIACASGVDAIGASLKKELKALVTLAEGIFPYALCLLTLFSMFLSNGDVFARIKIGGIIIVAGTVVYYVAKAGIPG
jgi:hypothetical protein